MSAFRTERRSDPGRVKRTKYIFVTGGVVSSLGQGAGRGIPRRAAGEPRPRRSPT